MAKQTINISVLADTGPFAKAMSGLQSTFSTVAKGAATLVAGVAGVGVAIGALALKGGIDRALNIEDAKAKLDALGHSTQNIDRIMESALAGVKGTSYGLGDMATVAASAAAAGVELGENMDSALRLVADSAAISGVSLGEMGSIFSKVWTSGKVGTEELNQIADRGIPIWTKLAEHYGVSAEELRKMVAEGKVDAATFEEVMEETVGGSAVRMGDTTRGAFANMGAALSRLGEMAANTFLPHMKDVFNEVIVVLDGLTTKLAPTFEKIGEWVEKTLVPLVSGSGQKVLDWFEKLTTAGDGLGPKIASLAALFSPFGLILSALKPILPQLADAFGEVGNILSTGLSAVLPTLTPLFYKVAGVISTLIVTILPPAVALFSAIVEVLVALIPPVVELATQFLDFLLPALDSLSAVLTTVTPLLSGLAGFLVENIDWVMAFGVAIGIIVGIKKAWAIATTAITVVTNAAMLAQKAFNAVLRANPIGIIITLLAAFVGALIYLYNNNETVKNAIDAAWAAIKSAVDGVVKWITGTAVPWVVGAWNKISNGVSSMWSSVSSAFNSFRTGVSNLYNSIKSAVDNAVRAFTNFGTQARNKVNDVIRFFRELPGKIVSALSGMAGRLTDVGSNMMKGLINGVKNMASRVVNAAKDVVFGAIDGAKRLLGIKSPSKVFAQLGKYTVQGLEKGLSGPNHLQSVMRGLTGQVTDGFNPSLAMDVSGAGGGGMGGKHYTVQVNTGVGDPVEIGRQVVRYIKNYEQLNGAM